MDEWYLYEVFGILKYLIVRQHSLMFYLKISNDTSAFYKDEVWWISKLSWLKKEISGQNDTSIQFHSLINQMHKSSLGFLKCNAAQLLQKVSHFWFILNDMPFLLKVANNCSMYVFAHFFTNNNFYGDFYNVDFVVCTLAERWSALTPNKMTHLVNCRHMSVSDSWSHLRHFIILKKDSNFEFFTYLK